MQNFELQFELGTKCFKFYQEILRLAENDRGFCFKKNARFCEEYDVTERTIQRWLKKLSDLKLIKIEIIKNKYRRIFATEMSDKCRPDVGVNNKLLTNKFKRDEIDESQIIEELKNEHGNDLIEAALKIATKNSKWNHIAYLKTMLENGFEPKAKKSTFKQRKKVIRREMIPDWLKQNNNKTLEQVQPTEQKLSSEDLAKIERMKQLQQQILNFVKH